MKHPKIKILVALIFGVIGTLILTNSTSYHLEAQSKPRTFKSLISTFAGKSHGERQLKEVNEDYVVYQDHSNIYYIPIHSIKGLRLKDEGKDVELILDIK